MDFPALAAKRRRLNQAAGVLADPDRDPTSPRAPEEEIVIELPEYDLRRAMTAEDPLSVVEAHRLNICFRLAWVLGSRMCPRCPRCNESGWGCQDLAGSNMRPCGGSLGGLLAFQGGNEHQGVGTPHFHGQAHVVCVYQFGTLKDIAERVEAGLLSTRSMVSFQDWFHVERSLDDHAHEAYGNRAEQDFFDRFKAEEHRPLAVIPAFLAEDAAAGAEGSLSAETYRNPSSLRVLEEEGKQFLRSYYADAQFVFNRVQHHVHRKCPDGSYEPLHACAKKGQGKKSKVVSKICKHDFPRRALPRTTSLICQGLARKWNLKVAGRRNSYGLWLGKRADVWQSGTHPVLAVHFRSNSHTMPNYRCPATSKSHSEECTSRTCAQRCSATADSREIKVVAKLSQRVQREATGYYCGYTFKGQPIGRKYLKAAASSLNFLTTGLEDKSDGQRWHRITNRLLVDMQHRCITRSAPEEWNYWLGWPAGWLGCLAGCFGWLAGLVGWLALYDFYEF